MEKTVFSTFKFLHTCFLVNTLLKEQQIYSVFKRPFKQQQVVSRKALG